MQSIVSPSTAPGIAAGLLSGEAAPPHAYGTRGPVGGPANSTNADSCVADSPTPSTETPPVRPPQDPPITLTLSDPAPWLAEKHLAFFRSRMLPCFPFIVFAPDTTAMQLRQDRLALFHAILTVTTFPTQE